MTLKENIAVGRTVRFEAEEGAVLDSYLHVQNGRGVNGVLVELVGGSAELAHDVAVHIAFARPEYLRREDVPAEAVAAERETVAAIARNEGKPEAQLDKIVEGRLNGWFKERVLLEQPFARDDKKTITQLLGGAEVRALRPGRRRRVIVSGPELADERPPGTPAARRPLAAGRPQALRGGARERRLRRDDRRRRRSAGSPRRSPSRSSSSASSSR